MKTLSFSKNTLLSLITLLALSGCGGGGGDGGAVAFVEPVAVQEETQYFVQRSSNENEDMLLYTKKVAQLVDDVATLQSSMLDGDTSFSTLINDFETTSDMYHGAIFNTLDEADKETIKTAYFTLSSLLANYQETIILEMNSIIIDEININTLASVNSVEPRAVDKRFFGLAKSITNMAVAVKRLVTGARETNDPVIREALSTKESVEGTIEIFNKLNITVAADADGEAIYKLYGKLSASEQRDVDNALYNVAPYAYAGEIQGIKFTGVDLMAAIKQADGKKVTLYKATMTDAGNIYMDTIGRPSIPTPKIKETFDDAVQVYKNVKTIIAPKKPFKIVARSKEKVTTDISDVKTTKSYEEAKVTLNTLKNKDGLKKLSLAEIEDSLGAVVKEKAKNDGDGDDTQLTSTEFIATMSVIPTIKTSDETSSILDVDIVLPQEFHDKNISMTLVSVDVNQTLVDTELPKGLIIDNFEDVIPANLNTTPLVVVDLVLAKDETVLSRVKISEDDDSIKYRVTAKIDNIYKLANVYLEIWDPSAIMGSSERVSLVNIDTHKQTIDWNVDVIGGFASMKLTRSDVKSFSDYIFLSGKSTTVVDNGYAGSYGGVYTSKTDDPANCLQKDAQNGLSVVIDKDQNVLASIVINGNTYTDNGFVVNGSSIFNDGSNMGVSWTGDFNDDEEINGTWRDINDGCIGTFYLVKQ